MAQNKRRMENWQLLAAALAVSLIGLFGCSSLPQALLSAQTAASKPSSPEMQINADGTLTLNLDVLPGKGAQKPAADLPPGQIAVTLPLHPGAQVTSQPFPLPDRTSPASQYVKAASAEFVLSVAEAEAQAWYQDEMAKAGYGPYGSGRAVDTPKKLHSEYYEFSPQKKGLADVAISFHQLAADQTLILYWAYEVVQPPRPTASLLPTDMVKLELTYNPGRTAQQSNPQPIVKTVTDPAVIKRLVEDINSMPLDTAAVKNCVNDAGQGATMHFVAKNGQTYEVWLHEACSDVSINKGRALVDVNATLWNAVTELSKQNS